MRLLAVYTTVASREDARRIASALVQRRLAACVQMSEIESVYTWDGAVRHEPEWRLLVKTTEARYGDLEAAILDLHPYELPAIHAMPLEHVHAPYGAWIVASIDAA